MSDLQGMIRAVVTSTLGGVGITWTGNTLLVADGSDFPRDGGQLVIEGDPTVYSYSAVTDGMTDDDPDTITTVDPAPAVMPGDEFRVTLWPTAVASVAEVALPESLEDTVPATIPHALKPYLPDGVRDPEAQEAVLIGQRDMAWVVVDILDQPEVVMADLVVSVDDAKAEALEAHTVATQATQDAQDAHNAAVDAAQAAAHAAGIAAGKADVLIQPDTPAADYQAATTLWIDTTGGANTPKRWDGNAWVVVTDKAAIGAAAAAASAQTTANNAASAAATAQTTATNALTSANGRNSRVTSTSAPSGTANPNTGLAWVDGDTWWRWDATTTKNVIGAWTYSGGAWAAEKIGDAVIAALDVNKLTVLGSARMAQAVVEKIIADAGYFKVITADKVVITSAEGMYPDPGFDDAALSAVRAANTGYTYNSTAKTMTGTNTFWLTKDGTSGDFNSVPLRVGATYVITIFTTSWASSGAQLARQDASSYVYVTGVTKGDRSEFTVNVTGADTRFCIHDPTGTLTINRIEIKSRLGGVLIEPGSINTPHLTAGALNFVEAYGMKLTAAEILSPVIKTAASGARVEITTEGIKTYNSSGANNGHMNGDIGSFIGYSFTGGTVTGGTVRTSASGARVEMSGDVLSGYSSGNRPTIQLDTTFNLHGTTEPALVFRKNASSNWVPMVLREDGVTFLNSNGTWYGRIQGDGSNVSINNAAPSGDITFNTSVANNGSVRMNVYKGGIYQSSMWQQFQIYSAATGLDKWIIRPISISGSVRAVLQFNGGGNGMPQTTLAANLHMDANGSFYRNSSARRFKADIRDISVDPYKILDVPVRDWIDATRLSDEPDFAERTPGVVAEEVLELGLDPFVTFEADGQVQGVLYERLPLLLIPVVRDLRDRINNLEGKTHG